MFSELDPILHSQLRLAIVSLLISEEKADFVRIKEVTEAVGYVTITKSIKENYPNTELQLTHKGLLAFENYVEALKSYLKL